MIKTVKVEKQLRLDELLKYILDNDIVGKRYEERMDYDSYSITHEVHVTGGGQVTIGGIYKPETTFTVEVEEEITEDTKFIWLVEANDKRIWNQKNASIRDVLDKETTEIRALINGKLQLIWEAK